MHTCVHALPVSGEVRLHSMRIWAQEKLFNLSDVTILHVAWSLYCCRSLCLCCSRPTQLQLWNWPSGCEEHKNHGDMGITSYRDGPDAYEKLIRWKHEQYFSPVAVSHQLRFKGLLIVSPLPIKQQVFRNYGIETAQNDSLGFYLCSLSVADEEKHFLGSC